MKFIRTSGYRGISAIGLLAASIVGSSSAAEDPSAYAHVIAPLLESKCVGCHGAEKQKGKLRMDSHAALLKGGSEGASLVPGNVADSLMVTRICLPADDEEHMPPEGKTQLTEGEVKLIRLWVEKGGTEALAMSQLAVPADLAATLTAIVSAPKKAPAVAVASKPAAPKVDEAAAAARKKLAEEVMKKVNATGASLAPIAQDTPELRFNALNVSDSFGDAQLAELAPIADQIATLDIARTKITDSGLAVVAQMTNLTKLHLEHTAITDAGMAHLSGLKSLEYLNLYDTKVGDAGLDRLKGLTSLSKLYLWQSKATPSGAERLRSAVPKLVVNLGWEYEAAKVAAAAPAPAVPAKAAPPVPAAIPAPPKPAVTAPAPAPKPVAPTASTPAPAPAPKPAAPTVASVPAPKPPTPPAPAPAPAVKPAPASVAAPSSSADEYAGVRKLLTSAHQDAVGLLAKSKETVTRTEMDVRVASNALNQARHHVEATIKGTEEANKQVAKLEAAAAAIQKALDAVMPHTALADVQKTLTADLAKAKQSIESAKAKVADARKAQDAAPAKAAEAEAKQVAQQKALEAARQRVPEYQAVVNAIQQTLDMIRQ